MVITGRCQQRVTQSQAQLLEVPADEICLFWAQDRTLSQDGSGQKQAGAPVQEQSRRLEAWEHRRFQMMVAAAESFSHGPKFAMLSHQVIGEHGNGAPA